MARTEIVCWPGVASHSNSHCTQVAFEIGAGSLEEAAEKFGQLAKEAIEKTVKELQELRRQAASSIVIPQGGLPPVPPGAGGGGKIQMPAVVDRLYALLR